MTMIPLLIATVLFSAVRQNLCLANGKEDVSTVCNSTTCGEKGICVSNADDYICHCPLGYTGRNCEKGFVPPPITMFADINLKEGGTIKCEKRCAFGLYIQAENGSLIFPTITTSNKNKTVNVNINAMPLFIVPDIGVPGLTAVEVSVGIEEEGDTNVCFLLEKQDEVCYHVQVSARSENSNATRNSTLSTYNLPSGSTLLCHSYCHMLIQTVPQNDGPCPHITTHGASSFAFSTFRGEPPCVIGLMCDGREIQCLTEIVYTHDPQHQLCIHTEIEEDQACYNVKDAESIVPSTYSANVQTESTTLPDLTTILFPNSTGHKQIVSDSTSLDKASSCKSTPCENQGFCIETGSNYPCLCPLGYTGTHCEEEMNMKGGNIKCEANRDCTIPIFVQKKPGQFNFPSVEEGSKRGNVSVRISPLPYVISINKGLEGLLAFDVILHATEEGKKNVCFVTKESGTTTDQICLDVEVTSDNDNKKSEIFYDNNLPNGTILQCDNSCHLLIWTRDDNGCVQVTTKGTSAWTFPTVQDTVGCLTDIVYIPEACSRDLCIEAGEPKEVICYTVEGKDTEVQCTSSVTGTSTISSPTTSTSTIINTVKTPAVTTATTTIITAITSGLPIGLIKSRNPAESISTSISKSSKATITTRHMTHIPSGSGLGRTNNIGNNADQTQVPEIHAQTPLTGYTTATTADLCASNPCLENSTCNGNGTWYSCICEEGWGGTHCNLTIVAKADGVSAAIVASAVVAPVAVIGVVAGAVVIKSCYGKCSLRNLVEVAPIDDLPELDREENDDEKPNVDDEEGRKKTKERYCKAAYKEEGESDLRLEMTEPMSKGEDGCVINF